MKKSIKTIILGLGMLFTGVVFTSAQDVTKISKNQDIQFNNETKPVEIGVEITKEFNFLSVHIGGLISKGEAQFEILDPKGKSKGKFSIQTEIVTSGESTTTSSRASGSMTKSFRNPLTGKWKIKITPVGSIKGQAVLEYDLIYNPQADVLEIEDIKKSTVVEGVRNKETVVEGKKTGR